MKRDRAKFESQLGGIAGLPAAEAFELHVQVGGEAYLPELMALNGAPFHSLWYPLLGSEPVVLLYEAFLGQPDRSPNSHAITRAKGATHFGPPLPTTGTHSLRSASVTLPHPEARACVDSGNVVLAGSPVNNPITGAMLNTLPSIRWVTEHDDGRESVYLLDKATARSYYPIRDEGGRLTHDLAVLSILPNPFAHRGSLISCAGIHGVGTQALLEFLAAPSWNKDLLDAVLLWRETLNLPLTVDAIPWRCPRSSTHPPEVGSLGDVTELSGVLAASGRAWRHPPALTYDQVRSRRARGAIHAQPLASSTS